VPIAWLICFEKGCRALKAISALLLPVVSPTLEGIAAAGFRTDAKLFNGLIQVTATPPIREVFRKFRRLKLLMAFVLKLCNKINQYNLTITF
jgi:hypothetical protein